MARYVGAEKAVRLKPAEITSSKAPSSQRQIEFNNR